MPIGWPDILMCLEAGSYWEVLVIATMLSPLAQTHDFLNAYCLYIITLFGRTGHLLLPGSSRGDINSDLTLAAQL